MMVCEGRVRHFSEFESNREFSIHLKCTKISVWHVIIDGSIYFRSKLDEIGDHVPKLKVQTVFSAFDCIENALKFQFLECAITWQIFFEYLLKFRTPRTLCLSTIFLRFQKFFLERLWIQRWQTVSLLSCQQSDRLESTWYLCRRYRCSIFSRRHKHLVIRGILQRRPIPRILQNGQRQKWYPENQIWNLQRSRKWCWKDL